MDEQQTFVLFGASGDLAKRKILPALYNLYRDGLTPRSLKILGVAMEPFTQDTFQDFTRAALEQFSRQDPKSDPAFAGFLGTLDYLPFDATKDEDYKALLGKVGSDPNRLFYLAMAPSFFGIVATKLKENGITDVSGWKRIIIEKPFGRDLQSATLLNDELSSAFEEEEIFRIDHYLGKEMVQNVETIRFANSIFEPIWNNRHIANVQITSGEIVGVEERAGYYEKSGALLDMVQNHMMQMLMMMAMEPPSRLETEAIRDEKVKVLRSLRRYDREAIFTNVVRGQYLSGKVGNQNVVGYLNEPGVSPTSNTETYVAAKMYVDNFRWAGVPFYIRTGKRMHTKSTKIVIEFKSMPENLFFNKNSDLAANLLTIHVNPMEGISLTINGKQERSGTVAPNVINFADEDKNKPEAYERLIHDAMVNDSTFFTRWDEVSLAWKWVDPVSQAFSAGQPLFPYVAGSTGPVAADDMLARDGFCWWN